MIRWSFWVDPWEHPFNTWNRFYSVLIPLAAVEPGLNVIDPLPPKEHVDFGPWKGPPPGPIKPGIPTPRQELKKWDFSIGFSINQGGPDMAAVIEGIPTKRVRPSIWAPKPWGGVLSVGGDYDYTAYPQYADYPDAVDWFTEDYFHDPHAIRIGPYTDETVPQIVKYI